jgi:predicted Zn finger-like uncharacterized protein
MILTCPACSTQYRLKDGAIPPEGRQVRCAACRHKWHEDGPQAESAAASGIDEPAGQWPVQREEVAEADGGEFAGGPPQPDAHQPEQEVATAPDEAAHDQYIAETPEPKAMVDLGRNDEPAPVAAAEQLAPPEDA